MQFKSVGGTPTKAKISAQGRLLCYREPQFCDGLWPARTICVQGLRPGEVSERVTRCYGVVGCKVGVEV